MNTWDVNLAACTVVEERHGTNPRPSQYGTAGAARASESAREYSEQSQIPTSCSKDPMISMRARS